MSDAGDRPGILAEVRNPLIFLALALLVIEGIFGLVVATSRMTSAQQFYSFLVMAGLFALVIILVAVITTLPSLRPSRKRSKHRLP